MIIFAIWIISCGNQSPIQYKEADGIIYFENTAIKLVIDQTMKIKVSYYNGEMTQSMVSDQSSPNDFLVIYDPHMNLFCSIYT